MRSYLRWADNPMGRFVNFEILKRQVEDETGDILPEKTWRLLVEESKDLFTLAKEYTNDVARGEKSRLLRTVKGAKIKKAEVKGGEVNDNDSKRLQSTTAKREAPVHSEGNGKAGSRTVLSEGYVEGRPRHDTGASERRLGEPREGQVDPSSLKLLDTVHVDGNLTDQQKRYFKDSQARDEESGELLKLYHGTPEAFTEFSKEKVGRTGYPDTQVGEGYF